MCKLNDRLNNNYFGVKRAHREIQIERMLVCERMCATSIDSLIELMAWPHVTRLDSELPRNHGKFYSHMIRSAATGNYAKMNKNKWKKEETRHRNKRVTKQNVRFPFVCN